MNLLHRHDQQQQDHHDHHDRTSASGEQTRGQQVERIIQKSRPGHAETGWKRRLNALQEFWTKINNDWIFNLSGLLAYNLLMSIFPILLVLIAAAGFVLGFISPNSQHQLAQAIASLFPQGPNTQPGQPTAGQTIVNVVLDNLRRSAGLVFIIGLVTAAFAGSRLFITIGSCFSVIFRLRPRDALHQNLMAFWMLLLYIVLIPIIFLASSVASLVARLVFGSDNGPAGALVRLLGIAIALVVAIALFAAIYVVVPNRPVHWKEVWRGTLSGAALLVLYEMVFPLYQSLFLKPSNYGSIAGFAVVILVFFYYFAFILLLGAEVNSWFAGQRETAADIAGIIHEVQAHDTTRGAAGPTAGTAQEDLQSHKGKAAMRNDQTAIAHERLDHKDDEQPPKFAEANSSNSKKTAEAAEQTSGYNTNRPMHRPEPGKKQNHDGASDRASDRASDGAGDGSDMRSGGAGSRGSSGTSSSWGSDDSRHGSPAVERAGKSQDMSVAARAAGEPSGQVVSVRGPARPEYAHPIPPQARDLPPQRPRSSMAPALAAAATAAIPVLMWLFGRNRRTS